MPPKKVTSTPNKPSDSATWTYDEGEEMCKDISDFQEKTKVDLEAMERRLMDSKRIIEDKLELLMKDMKEFISHTRNGGSNQSDNVFQGAHDQNKRDDNITMGFENIHHSSPKNNNH